MAAGSAMATVASCIPDLQSSPTDAGAPLAADFCGDGIIDLNAGEQCDPGPGAGDAGIGGCSPSCQMQCPSGALPWSSNHHCYQAAGPSLSFKAATGVCTGGSHVATFASEEEFQQVLPLLDSGRPFWVWLETTSSTYPGPPYEPGWQPSCAGCYAHTPTPDAMLPRLADASFEGGVDDCVVALGDPQEPWQRYPCRGLSHQLVDVVCELEPVGKQSTPCEAGICIDLVKTHPGKRYVYQAKPASADSAKMACIALGGSLVVLQSNDEREQLWRELSRLTVVPKGVWIGLSQISAGSRRVPASWAWDNGKPATGPDACPSEWATGQPLPNGQAATPRAFLYQNQSAPAIDDTLARDEPSLTDYGGTLPYVCEIP
jgi:hypothetical protein